MLMGEILGAIAVLLIVAQWFADYRYERGKKEGYAAGLKVNAEESYLQGAADAENFMARTEEEVLQERRKLWDSEDWGIGA